MVGRCGGTHVVALHPEVGEQREIVTPTFIQGGSFPLLT